VCTYLIAYFGCNVTPLLSVEMVFCRVKCTECRSWKHEKSQQMAQEMRCRGRQERCERGGEGEVRGWWGGGAVQARIQGD
jgi:hypothetical protein